MARADYPTDAINSCSNVPDMGASVSFSGCLIDNLDSLAAENMDGYAPGWNTTYAQCALRGVWGVVGVQGGTCLTCRVGALPTMLPQRAT